MGGWQNGGWDVFSFASNPATNVAVVWNAQRDFGAKGDGKWVIDGATAVGSRLINSASNPWVSTDVNKLLFAQFAGAASVTPVGTITAVNTPGQIQASFTCQQNLSGVAVFWATDDTAALTAWLNKLIATNGRGQLPTGHYGYNGALPSITASLEIEGDGCFEQQGSIELYPNSVNIPAIFPYFRGSVLWQFAAATNGLSIPVSGLSVNLRDFGIMFAGMYANTGHGIQCKPAADGGNFVAGITSSKWDSVKVYGHDGNHYGFEFWNIDFYCTFEDLHSYGGGGLHVRGDTTRTFYGNSIFDHFISVEFLAGSGNGILLEATTGWRMNLLQFNRLQSWVWAPATPIPGTTVPGASNYRLWIDNNVQRVEFIGPDMETNVGGGLYWGNQGIRVMGGFTTGYGGWIITNSGSDIGFLIAAAAGQSADMLQIADPSNTNIFIVDAAGKTSKYNGVATQGVGLAAIYQAPAPTLAQTAAVASIATITSPNDAVKHTYRVSGTVNITTHGTESINLQVTYTDDNGTARTKTIPISTDAGTVAAAANAAGEWQGDAVISVNPNTAITVKTAGTFTGATYNCSAVIEQIR